MAGTTESAIYFSLNAPSDVHNVLFAMDSALYPRVMLEAYVGDSTSYASCSMCLSWRQSNEGPFFCGYAGSYLHLVWKHGGTGTVEMLQIYSIYAFDRPNFGYAGLWTTNYGSVVSG